MEATRAGTVEAGPGMLEGAPGGLLVLNLLDGLFTLLFLQLGMAWEANPLMRWAYEASPLTFMSAKLGAVTLGVALLWRHRDTPLARVALRVGVLVYLALVVYHLAFLSHWLRSG